ncbi:MAG: hypothetical protein Q4E28_05060 [Clostridia bacterium]|nr:hypothetical protein [Clostridia bacterium]
MSKRILILQILLWLIFTAISIVLLVLATTNLFKVLQALVLVIGIINLIFAILNYKKGVGNGR